MNIENEIITVKLTDLKSDANNPNRMSKEQRRGLNKSLREFKNIKLVLIDQNNVIIDGHQRIDEMKALGVEETQAIRYNVTSEAERIKIRQVANKLYGEHDKKMDANDFLVLFQNQQLGELAELLAKPQEEFQRALEKHHGIEFVKEDNFDVDSALNEPPITKLGDVWQLGRHRLMCGDSTKKEDIDRLLEREKADICFTSPPYNVEVMEYNKGTERKYVDYDDRQSDSQYLQFLGKNIALLLSNCYEVYYNIALLGGNKRTIIDLLSGYKQHFRDLIYWKKTSAPPQMEPGILNNSVELILVFSPEVNPSRRLRHASFNKGGMFNVIEGKSASDNKLAHIHKATFPLYLPAAIITNFTFQNDSVLDCFGGTGTTLIAAEQLQRICYIMELSPIYCTIIIKRWEQLTNQKATLIDSKPISESVENAPK